MSEYRGITYPKFLQYKWIYWLWEKFMCPKDMHLLDETKSLEDHDLVCDCCDLIIEIKGFDESYMGDLKDVLDN